MNLVSLRGLEKRFGSTRALAGVDLELPSGSILGFLGANGAGKSTTLRVMLGLLKVDAGEVRVLGHDPSQEARAVRAETGVMFDRDGHYERLTARSNLEFHAGVRGMHSAAARARIDELLRRYGLWDRQRDRVAMFSKGMRQKLAIARAMLHRPRLLLLDEPFTGLDPAAAIELRESLRDQAKSEGIGILLTSHDLHHVERFCDRVVVIERGRIVASGTPAELTSKVCDGAQEVYVVGENLSQSLLETMQRDGVVLSGQIEADGGARVLCSPEQVKQLGRELVLRGVALQTLAARSRSLEEVFVQLVTVGRELAG